MTDANAERRLVLRRVLPASPDRVFAAWTDPASLSRWMSPNRSASATLDLRVGGAIRIVMKGPDWDIEHTGEYREIDPPARLVFTWNSPYTGPEPSIVTIELRPHGDGTELTLIHEQLPADQVDPHRGGWAQILENLESVLRGADSLRPES
jgi:uncharacterized protein YndB with AHSA1/START domain